MTEKVLYFASRRVGPVEEIDRLLHCHLDADRVVRCQSVEEMHQHIARPGGTIRVGVLAVAEERELLELYSMRQMLFDLHLLVLLPEHDEPSIALAHSLRPRFIGFIKRDMEVMEEILRMTLNRKLKARNTFDEKHIGL